MSKSASKSVVFLFLSLYWLTFSLSAEGQAPAGTKSAGKQTTERSLPEKKDAAVKKDDPAKTAEAERVARERRMQARSLLISLATDARTFRDSILRARSLARIADALWRVDAERGRVLFRKAWEAAEVADQESQQKLQEEIRQQRAKTGGGFAINLPPDVRREVLKLAARHDHALGEEFLEKLTAQKKEAARAKAGADQYSFETMAGSDHRLGLASELLLAGDVEQALQFADPALNVISIATVDFLTELREKSSVPADQRYLSMLASANIDPHADANTVSLLSSYIFTPHRFVTFSPGGGVSTSQQSGGGTPAAVTPELRTAFLQTAAGILLRPQLPPDQDQSTSGVFGKYQVIKRLLPFFEQYATRETAEAVGGQLAALKSLVADSARGRDDDSERREVEAGESDADRERSILDRIDRVKTSAERDELYMHLALMLAGQGDIRAREFVGKVEETEMRKQAQAYIDAVLSQAYVQKKLIDQALDFVRKGYLTPIQRVWVFTRCATLLAKTDREKASQLLDEAALDAQRIDGSDPFRPRGLFAIANVFALIDATRVWDATFDAVRAANSAEGFSGEDGELALKFQSKGYSAVYSNDVPEFDVQGIFRELAIRDYERAVELARGFQREGPRAVATIAIARAWLEPKTTSAANPRN